MGGMVISVKCQKLPIIFPQDFNFSALQRAFSMLCVKCQGSNFTKLYVLQSVCIYILGYAATTKYWLPEPGAEYVETPLPRLPEPTWTFGNDHQSVQFFSPYKMYNQPQFEM